MHFAFVIDDYLPNSTRVGAKMFHELAQEFLSLGHKVTIITPNTDPQAPKLKVDLLDGINIWRFSNGPVKDVGKIKRAINETLMSFNAWKAVSSHINKNTFDGVVFYSPSIFFGSLVNKIKINCECNSYLILRDLFPQWAIDSKMISERSLITRYFRFFESINYAAADHIGLMSERNNQLFNRLNPKLLNTHVLYNWASFSVTESKKSFVSIRKQLKLNDKIIFFYGGNIGHAQDMTNLMILAKGFKNYPEAHFLFVGQGDEVDLIKKLAIDWSLNNVTILPSVSQLEFKQLLSEVDVGLFSLAKHHTAHNFPGKLLGYMVNALPILGSVNPDNDLKEIINSANAGAVLINGEDESFLFEAKKLLASKKLRSEQGHAGRELLKNRFSVGSAAKAILGKLDN